VATATKRRGYETLRDMVLSLGVILGAVLLFVALQPKHAHNPVPVVDYQPQVDLLAHSASFPVLAPDPVPAGWQVNYARIATDGPNELHMGLVKDQKRFAQLDETDRPNQGFLDAAKVPGTPAGTVSAGGEVYQVRQDGTGPDGTVALVRQLPRGALLTLSNGGAGNGVTMDELVALAGSLKVQPKR
jgi:hypothetical protein